MIRLRHLSSRKVATKAVARYEKMTYLAVVLFMHKRFFFVI